MTPLPDQPIRQRIGPWTEDGLADLSAFERDKNFVVRAAAGSGKTTALVARMVALVRTGVRVEDMVAITFTRKAAGEMQERFYAELQRAARHAEGEEAECLQAALDEVPRGFIGTIHAFCARLLRERPEAAGVPRDFSAGIEDRDKEELRRRVWRRYVQEAWDERHRLARDLVDAGVELDELEAFFGRLCTFPDLTPYTNGPAAPPDFSDAMAAARDLVHTWRPTIPDPLDGNPDGVIKGLRRAQNMQRHLDLTRPAEQAEFLEAFEGMLKNDEQAHVTLARWPDRDDAYALRDDIVPALVTETVRPALQQWRAYVHGRIARFVEPAVDAFRRERWTRGQLTFGDLLHATAELLRTSPDARQHFQQQYERILVDEFQDTDPIQAQILFYLTGRRHGETDWTATDPEPGRLFIVGDDKQSIYGFRRADMRVFDRVRRLIDAQPKGEAVDLRTNFRSLPEICDWCDRAFSELFVAAATETDQAEYVPFAAANDAVKAWPAIRQLTTEKKYRNKAASIVDDEAARIAQYIADACARDAPLLERDGEALIPGTPGDFMILTRTKARLATYAEALAERGVPYTIAGGQDARDSEELRGLVDLLACVFRPDDPVARVAYLRGPLVGLGDDELYAYRQAGGSFDRIPSHLPNSVRADPHSDLADRLEAAFRWIRQARDLLEAHRPSAAIGRLVDEIGLIGRSLQDGPLASLQAGRLLRVLTEVRHLDAQGHTGYAIWQELERIVRGDVDLDGMTLETGEADSVRLMNVHKAKGLQANVVFLADPYQSRYPPEPTGYVDREAGAYVRPVFNYGTYRRSLQYAPQEWAERFKPAAVREQAAEEHRLQYVAATRAQRLLIVSRYAPKSGSGFWADLYPALDAHGAPEVEIPAAEAAAPAPVPMPDVEGRAQRRREQLRTCEAPAHQVRTVTGGEKPSELVGTAESGYGRSFGTAMHELFEIRIRERHAGKPLGADLIKRVLADHVRADEQAKSVRRARRMLDGWTESRCWSEVLGAERVLAELPVARYLNASEPTLERGVIDLLYLHEGNWTLIDFKTDAADSEAAPDALRERYASQVRAYAVQWRQATGHAIDEAGLWWADRGQWVPVQTDAHQELDPSS